MPLSIFAAQTAAGRIHDTWVWYVIRASGFVGIVLLILLMLSGIGHITGLTYKVIEPVKAWAVHKAMGIALGLAVLVHALTIIVHRAAPFTLTETLVPFARTFSNQQSIVGLRLDWLALSSGILAAYGSYIVIFSSFDSVGWIRSHKHLWTMVHWVSYLVIFLALVHGILAGTDLKSGLLRWAWLGFTILMAAGIVSRLTRGHKTAH